MPARLQAGGGGRKKNFAGVTYDPIHLSLSFWLDLLLLYMHCQIKKMLNLISRIIRTLVKILTGSLRITEDPQRPIKDP